MAPLPRREAELPVSVALRIVDMGSRASSSSAPAEYPKARIWHGVSAVGGPGAIGRARQSPEPDDLWRSVGYPVAAVEVDVSPRGLWEGLRSQSPDSLHPVGVEDGVVARHGNAFGLGLGNQHPIEGIAMGAGK